MKPAARALDPHTCPLTWPAPHSGGLVTGPGVSTVLIGYRPAATRGTSCGCAVPSANVIAKGSSTVLIGGEAAARVGDPTTHGGAITAGCASVDIGG